MAAFRMDELMLKKVTISDASHCKVGLSGNGSTHDRLLRAGHIIASRRPLRVLVANDEQDMAHSLARRVRRWGHTVQVAVGGLAALRSAAVQHPDVLLLEMEMLPMDGCRVARNLRIDFPRQDCFIIGFTACAHDERRQQSIEAKIDLLLIKPVDPSVVETLLLLERVHVDRTQRGNSMGLAAKGEAPSQSSSGSTIESAGLCEEEAGIRCAEWPRGHLGESSMH